MPRFAKLIDYQEFCGIPHRRSSPPTGGTKQLDEITPQELKALLDGRERPLILDVRNPEEIAICRIAGSTVIPLPELANRLAELDRSLRSSFTARAVSAAPRRSASSSRRISHLEILREEFSAGSRKSTPACRRIDRSGSISARSAQIEAVRSPTEVSDLVDLGMSCGRVQLASARQIRSMNFVGVPRCRRRIACGSVSPMRSPRRYRARARIPDHALFEVDVLDPNQLDLVDAAPKETR